MEIVNKFSKRKKTQRNVEKKQKKNFIPIFTKCCLYRY